MKKIPTFSWFFGGTGIAMFGYTALSGDGGGIALGFFGMFIAFWLYYLEHEAFKSSRKKKGGR